MKRTHWPALSSWGCSTFASTWDFGVRHDWVLFFGTSRRWDAVSKGFLHPWRCLPFLRGCPGVLETCSATETSCLASHGPRYLAPNPNQHCYSLPVAWNVQQPPLPSIDPWLGRQTNNLCNSPTTTAMITIEIYVSLGCCDDGVAYNSSPLVRS